MTQSLTTTSGHSVARTMRASAPFLASMVVCPFRWKRWWRRLSWIGLSSTRRTWSVLEALGAAIVMGSSFEERGSGRELRSGPSVGRAWDAEAGRLPHHGQRWVERTEKGESVDAPLILALGRAWLRERGELPLETVWASGRALGLRWAGRKTAAGWVLLLQPRPELWLLGADHPAWTRLQAEALRDSAKVWA